MNISRDTRIDRRRRVLRDANRNEMGQESSEHEATRSRSHHRNADDATAAEGAGGKRSAGYSQDVRRACGTRLVQYIPVRFVSFSAVIFCSLLATGILLAAHYLIYVSGDLPWYGHPLAVAFDATHPQSVAAWMGSHLWLMCLVSTLLTFQLRRHKLDDYTGEYRLWFWLVLTCLLASIDSTTHLFELMGLALDRWSQLNVGWSGISLVQATMAVLIGVLGIRLCSELKSVPMSLICWLLGLMLWAGGAALAQERLRIDISLQMRFWLRAVFWLGGLTLVWIASLAYLRQVYIAAQRRFLLRNRRHVRRTGQPIGQRLKQNLSLGPWKMFRKGNSQDSENEPKAPPGRRQSKSLAAVSQDAVSHDIAVPGANALARKADPEKGKSGWFEKLRAVRTLVDDDAPEYKKYQVSIRKPETNSDREKRQTSLGQSSDHNQPIGAAAKPDKQAQIEARQAARAAAAEAKRAKRDAVRSSREEKREAARKAKLERKLSGQGWRWSRLVPLAAVGAALSKIKLPSLSGLKLSPPESDAEASGSPEVGNPKSSRTAGPIQSKIQSSHPQSSQGLRPIAGDRPLPGTVRTYGTEDDGSVDDERTLSRAERKRLRRQGRAA